MTPKEKVEEAPAPAPVEAAPAEAPVEIASVPDVGNDDGAVPRTAPGGFAAEQGGPYGGGTETPGTGTEVQAVA